ncbi:MAG TPA: inositol monophosphatase family protein [Chloroflexota bacterium]|nr:inositol monophosphatase family protein [Chloroflexota bacterium]
MTTEPESVAPIAPTLLLEVAVETAREAGALLREKLGAPRQIRFKSAHNDLVTDGDQAAEALITARVRARFPDHRILAEEGATGAPISPYRWLIDPVDGTTNFAHNVPAFAVSIGVEHDDQLQAGVVYNPASDELFAAALGHGATLNGQPIAVTPIWRPESALVGCGAITFRRQGRTIKAARAFWNITQGCRTTGAAALDLCYVACGRFELFCAPSLRPWDVAAGALIVREAGGEVTDFDGGPHRLDRQDILASNGAVHSFALGVVRGEITGHPTIAGRLKALRKRTASRK